MGRTCEVRIVEYVGAGPEDGVRQVALVLLNSGGDIERVLAFPPDQATAVATRILRCVEEIRGCADQ